MRDHTARIIGRIVAGEFDVAPEALRSSVRGWPDGLVTIDITHGGKKHSRQQEKTWFKLVVEPLCEHIGVDYHEKDQKAAVHYALVRECFGETWNATFKCFIPNKRSSQLNSKDYAEMMDWAVRYVAQEHGLVLTLPSEGRAK